MIGLVATAATGSLSSLSSLSSSPSLPQSSGTQSQAADRAVSQTATGDDTASTIHLSDKAKQQLADYAGAIERLRQSQGSTPDAADLAKQRLEQMKAYLREAVLLGLSPKAIAALMKQLKEIAREYGGSAGSDGDSSVASSDSVATSDGTDGMSGDDPSAATGVSTPNAAATGSDTGKSSVDAIATSTSAADSDSSVDATATVAPAASGESSVDATAAATPSAGGDSTETAATPREVRQQALMRSYQETERLAAKTSGSGGGDAGAQDFVNDIRAVAAQLKTMLQQALAKQARSGRPADKAEAGQASDGMDHAIDDLDKQLGTSTTALPDVAALIPDTGAAAAAPAVSLSA